MATFYICRHGETESNKNKRHQGWIDTPLTEDGQAHAKTTARKLQNTDFDLIISSDLGRAFVTAYIIARALGYKSEIIRNKGLREVNYGDLANTHYGSAPNLTPEEATNFVFPNGESLAQMQERVLSTLASLAEIYPDKTILLVGHDGTINSIRAGFTGENIGVANQISSPHDFVAKVEWDKDRAVSFSVSSRQGAY